MNIIQNKINKKKKNIKPIINIKMVNILKIKSRNKQEKENN